MKRHHTRWVVFFLVGAGAIFFFSADQRFIIKEVVTSERHALMGLLPSYVEHMRRYPESLLPRIVQVISLFLSWLAFFLCDHMAIIHPGALAAYQTARSVRPVRPVRPVRRLPCSPCSPPAKLPRCQGHQGLLVVWFYSPSSTPAAATAQICSIRMYRRTLNFMVMENIFSTAEGLVKPSAVYDIKGSWIDRNAGGTRSRKPEAGTYKDMDLNDKLYLPSSFRNRLRATLDADSLFLVGHRIMDYSLLLGVCNRPFVNGTKGGVQRRAPLSPQPSVVGGGGGGAAVPGQQPPGGGARGDGGAAAGEEGGALPFHE
eukprot:COSAG01_NODE_10043_length_2263_cov_1.897921_3_plen_314_part_01